MLKPLLGVLLFFSLSGIAQAKDGMSAKLHKVYKGEDGLQATIIELVSPADTFLIEIKGSGSDFDKAVYLHTLKSHDGGRRFSYDTKFKNEDFSTIYSEQTYWGNTIFFQNPSNYAKKFSLYYSEGDTKKLDPKKIFARYKKAPAGKK